MIFIIVDIEMGAPFVNRGMSNTLKIKSTRYRALLYDVL